MGIELAIVVYPTKNITYYIKKTTLQKAMTFHQKHKCRKRPNSPKSVLDF